MHEKIRLNSEERRGGLSLEQIRITRGQGTEPPCSGQYHDFHGEGIYRCTCCGYELFNAREKSPVPQQWTFRAPITDERIATEPHIADFLIRTRVKCGRCGTHLGYVLFPDRNPPAWTRYLINSAALTFQGEQNRAAEKPSLQETAEVA
jgi:peptide-methionine (R)-S-oxide reductase